MSDNLNNSPAQQPSKEKRFMSDAAENPALNRMLKQIEQIMSQTRFAGSIPPNYTLPDFNGLPDKVPASTADELLSPAFIEKHDPNELSYRHPNFYEAETARGTTMVWMDSRGGVVADNNEEKRIATFGLGGCTAVALAIKLADGTRHGYIQHYSPLMKQISECQIALTAQKFSEYDVAAAKAVVMTPGRYKDCSLQPEDDSYLALEAAISEFLPDATLHRYAYSTFKEEGRYGQGTLRVDLLPNGEIEFFTEETPVL